MNELDSLWHFCGQTIQAIFLVYVPYRILPKKKFAENRLWLFALIALAFGVICYLFDIIFDPSKLIELIVLLVFLTFFYIVYLFQARLYLGIIIMSSCICCVMLLHFLVVSFLSILTGSFMLYTWQHILAELILMPLLTFYLVRFSYIPKLDPSSRFGVAMAILMLMLAFITDALDAFDVPFLINLMVCIVSFIVVLVLYYLFFSMIKEYEGKKLQTQHLDSLKRYLEEAKENYATMRYLRHELKNHVFYMNALLDEEKYDSLKDYFNQIYLNEYNVDLIESGNNSVNTILNQKVAYAKSKGISVAIKTTLPEEIEIDESHLCAVISNLFDNAIEACELQPDPEITVTVRQKGEYIHIACKNNVTFDVLKVNASLMTTKKTPHHGIGLQVVQSIVDSYDGAINFNMEGMYFIVDVLLRTGEYKKKS